tara:strand:+ start:1199 stop:1639 length:441 start_codon:yes stop_codon:yes gene_type:complete
MAVTYDDISYKYIEKGLKTIINNEFKNVYVSPEFTMRGTECIRIMVDSSENDQTTNAFERRIFSVVVRYYQKGNVKSEKAYAGMRRKADMLRKHLIDNQTANSSTAKWVALDIDTINFNIQDEENEEIDNLNITEFLLSLTHHNPL